MGAHLDAEGRFQSDKYPTTPPDCVPLKVTDATARDLLWTYAQRRRSVDAEFSADLEARLLATGPDPGAVPLGDLAPTALWAAVNAKRIDLGLGDYDLAQLFGTTPFEIHNWSRGRGARARTLLAAERWLLRGSPAPEAKP